MPGAPLSATPSLKKKKMCEQCVRESARARRSRPRCVSVSVSVCVCVCV
jgi:hypothetical protein